MTTRKQIIDAADKAGWNCDIEKNEKGGWSISFNTDTHFGQDVNYDYEVGYMNQIDNEVYDTWQGFDPDEEALLWVGPDGHGKNGAPDRLRDIIADMDEVEESLESLYNELRKVC